jgi:predicted DNA-binding transcriptional regulator YafY
VDRAIREARKLRLRYQDQQGAASERTVRPLAIFYWGSTWVLTAWCELRQDFRNFRLDRIQEAAPLAETYSEEPGKMLPDYFRRIAERYNLPPGAFDSE